MRAQGRADDVGLAAREAAVRDAQRAAVAQALGAMLPGLDPAPFDPILQYAPGYVARHDLLRHDTVDTWTRVEIDAEINEAALRADVAAIALPRFPDPPSVLLLIGERVGGDRLLAVPDFGAAEVCLKERLARLKFPVAGADSLDAIYAQRDLIAVVNGDREAQRAFAERCLEDVVVIGAAVATHEPGPEGSNVLRNRAALTVQVYRGGDGKLLDAFATAATVHGEDPDVAGAQAVEDACVKVAGDLVVSAVLAVLARPHAFSAIVTVRDPGNPETLESLAAFLRTAPGAEEVRALYIAPALGRVRIFGGVPLAELARMLDGVVVEGRRLSVRQAYGTAIEALVE